MFHDNNIPVTQNDLINLFFRKKDENRQRHKVEFYGEEDYSIDFKKLVEFATDERHQKRFEEFMRTIKKREVEKRKIMEEKIKLRNSLEKNPKFRDTNEFSIDTINNLSMENSRENTFTSNFNNNNNKNLFARKSSNLKVIKEEQKLEGIDFVYYPFTFNKILEHFNRKGKIKDNFDKIKNSIVIIFKQGKILRKK